MMIRVWKGIFGTQDYFDQNMGQEMRKCKINVDGIQDLTAPREVGFTKIGLCVGSSGNDHNPKKRSSGLKANPPGEC